MSRTSRGPLHDGIAWEWETFPEYLDFLGGLQRSVDFGALLPYASVRAYVMEERSIDQQATRSDIERMTRIVRQAVASGAMGLSMSRTLAHRAADGSMVPGTNAEFDELLGVCRPLGELGRGILELAPPGSSFDAVGSPQREIVLMRILAAEIQRPISFALVQNDVDPHAWRELLDEAADALAEGVPLHPQVHARSPMVLMGLGTSLNPLRLCPSYAPLADLPPDVQTRRIREDAALEHQLVLELRHTKPRWAAHRTFEFSDLFALGSDPPRYEPHPDESVEALAARSGRDGCQVVLDVLLSDGGRGLLSIPILNFSERTHEPVLEMLRHPATILGLADGGAHCNSMCDAGLPTYLLEWWVRDRDGDRLDLETAVRKMTRDTAEVFGLPDRGILAPGYRADVNVIDFEHVAQLAPRLVHDLPTGASRFIQKSRGYEATMVGGELTFVKGEHTGALPGRLLRSGQPEPAR